MISVEVVFFEDPACSWCWAFQPVTTAFAYEFADAIESGRIRTRTVMGGLRDRPAENVHFIAQHWTKAQAVSNMPFEPAIWKTHTLQTTFVACRAVKAASLVHPVAGDRLLRRLREAFYVEKTPIDSEETVLALARDIRMPDGAAVDPERLQDYMTSGRADAVFERDRQEAAGIGFGFPTVVIRATNDDEPRVLNGSVPYRELRDAVISKGITAAERRGFRGSNSDWSRLFDIHHRLTVAEIEEVTGGLPARAAEQLSELGIETSGHFLCRPLPPPREPVMTPPPIVLDGFVPPSPEDLEESSAAGIQLDAGVDSPRREAARAKSPAGAEAGGTSSKRNGTATKRRPAPVPASTRKQRASAETRGEVGQEIAAASGGKPSGDDTPSESPSETGPSETGPSETGPSETGPSETGPSETGNSETGAAEKTKRKVPVTDDERSRAFPSAEAFQFRLRDGPSS